MKDPVSRLKKEDKELENRWDLMREATTFSRILEMKLWFEIGQKLLRSSVDRDGFFEKRLDKGLIELRWKNSFRKREIVKIWDDWTEFIEAEFQKAMQCNVM